MGAAPAIRAVRSSDCEAVLALVQRMGMAQSFTPETWRARWRRLFEESPALRLDRPPPATGFVAEEAGRIAGFFGSIPALYRFRGRRLVAGIATGWAVDPGARGRGAFLAQRYFRQPHVDLLVNGTANEASAVLSTHFRCVRTPSVWVESTLRWPVSASALLAKLVPAGWLFGPALRLAFAASAVRPPHPIADPERVISQLAPGEIGAEFDALFERVAAADDRLLADRSAACLRWRFDAPYLDVSLLCLRRGGQLDGFAVLEHLVSETRGLRRVRLLDLLAAPDDAEAAHALLWAAFDHARARGADLLEASLLPSRAEPRTLSRARRLRWVGGTRDVFVLPRDAELSAFFEQRGTGPDGWWLTEFDRDASI
jgi:hypothetical protein